MSDRTARFLALLGLAAALALFGMTDTNDPAAPDYGTPLDTTSATP